MARDAWTDERLDDLKASVDRVDQRMEAGFAEMRAEIRVQSRMMLQLFATTLIGFLGVIATILTHT